MRTLSLSVLSALALAFAGSALPEEPTPPAEVPKAPSAELRIDSIIKGVGTSSWVARYATETCDQGQRLASFNVLKRGDKKVEVPIGTRIYLLAYAHKEPPVGAEHPGKTSCRGMASFVPENGKVYDIKHDLETRNCPLLINEAGAPVKTYQKHKVTGACKKAD